jgi:hypothetical protein
MEHLEWGYLYTVALCAMAFVSFSIIALVLQQSAGRSITKLHIYRMHQYIESGFVAVAFAMLPPLLAILGLPLVAVWRVSSATIALFLIVWLALFPWRRRSRVKGPIPMQVAVFTALWIPILMWLLANSLANEPSGSSVVLAATWRLTSVVLIFLISLDEFLASSSGR